MFNFFYPPNAPLGHEYILNEFSVLHRNTWWVTKTSGGRRVASQHLARDLHKSFLWNANPVFDFFYPPNAPLGHEYILNEFSVLHRNTWWVAKNVGWAPCSIGTPGAGFLHKSFLWNVNPVFDFFYPPNAPLGMNTSSMNFPCCIATLCGQPKCREERVHRISSERFVLRYPIFALGNIPEDSASLKMLTSFSPT